MTPGERQLKTGASPQSVISSYGSRITDEGFFPRADCRRAAHF